MVLLLLASVVSSLVGDDGSVDPVGQRATTTSSTTEVVPVTQAPTAAEMADRIAAQLSFPAERGDLVLLLNALCQGSTTAAADDAGAIAEQPAQQVELLDAAGDAAEDLCPGTASSRPGLMNEVYSLVSATSTTTTTAPPPVVTQGTTAPPPGTTPTTRAPVATQPPATAPPVTEPPSAVHSGAYCSPEGATGFETAGTPMTCAGSKCDGTPYDHARWRRTTC